MNYHKLAALRVSQLSTSDKRWLLSRLDERERDILAKHAVDFGEFMQSNKTGFSELLDDVDVNDLGKDNVVVVDEVSENIDCQIISEIMSKVSLSDFRAVLDNTSSYFVALLIASNEEVGAKYLPYCSIERARKIREYVSNIRQPIPPLLLQGVGQVVSEEFVVKANKNERHG